MSHLNGHFAYSSNTLKENLTSQQLEYAFVAFEKLFVEIKPSRILEIGTSFGGTTQFFRDKLIELELQDTVVRSYDIIEREYFGRMKNTGIDIRIENIFTDSYQDLKNPNLIKEFIHQEGTTLVVCDGGSKKNEFRLLAPLLKKGDIIMAHDYVDTYKNFEDNYKDKIWNWREIGEEDIQEICLTYNLVPFMQDVFSKAVWACRRKV